MLSWNPVCPPFCSCLHAASSLDSSPIQCTVCSSSGSTITFCTTYSNENSDGIGFFDAILIDASLYRVIHQVVCYVWLRKNFTNSFQHLMIVWQVTKQNHSQDSRRLNCDGIFDINKLVVDKQMDHPVSHTGENKFGFSVTSWDTSWTRYPQLAQSHFVILQIFARHVLFSFPPDIRHAKPDSSFSASVSSFFLMSSLSIDV